MSHIVPTSLDDLKIGAYIVTRKGTTVRKVIDISYRAGGGTVTIERLHPESGTRRLQAKTTSVIKVIGCDYCGTTHTPGVCLTEG